jgi:hypothetical protein
MAQNQVLKYELEGGHALQTMASQESTAEHNDDFVGVFGDRYAGWDTMESTEEHNFDFAGTYAACHAGMDTASTVQLGICREVLEKTGSLGFTYTGIIKKNNLPRRGDQGADTTDARALNPQTFKKTGAAAMGDALARVSARGLPSARGLSSARGAARGSTGQMVASPIKVKKVPNLKMPEHMMGGQQFKYDLLNNRTARPKKRPVTPMESARKIMTRQGRDVQDIGAPPLSKEDNELRKYWGPEIIPDHQLRVMRDPKYRPDPYSSLTSQPIPGMQGTRSAIRQSPWAEAVGSKTPTSHDFGKGCKDFVQTVPVRTMEERWKLLPVEGCPNGSRFV